VTSALSVADDACTTCGSAVRPSVHPVRRTIPSASLETVVVPSDPPPPVTASVICCPPTALPNLSLKRSRTGASGAPASADGGVVSVSVSCTGSPASTLAMNDSAAAPDRNVRASCPAIVPSVQPVIVTTPSALAVADAGAFPKLAVTSTTAPASGFSSASVTRAEMAAVTGSPARPLNAIGEIGTMCAAGPATPVAVTTSGATPDTETVIVFVSARGPSVHVPTDLGDADVRAGVPASVPPPDETPIVTLTSPIAAPDAS
jgi:hypothetical protein